MNGEFDDSNGEIMMRGPQKKIIEYSDLENGIVDDL